MTYSVYFDGSSPRLRGARERADNNGSVGRIIPASAGSTFSPTGYSPAESDHPRVCGEHSSSGRRSSPSGGSSPRLRGAPNIRKPRRDIERIIPASAGSTETSTDSTHDRTDHPRVCGEHIRVADRWHKRSGSSPRLRGARFSVTTISVATRIIPASAGSTEVERFDAVDVGGSSPRLRGARHRARGCGHARRIIPASAGSTGEGFRFRVVGRDHPRVCGEHSLLMSRMSRFAGSSPRLRGALIGSRRPRWGRRIIPASAGSTGRCPG